MLRPITAFIVALVLSACAATVPHRAVAAFETPAELAVAILSWAPSWRNTIGPRCWLP